MTTQTTTNSPVIVPSGDTWQVVPPAKDMSIEGILKRLTDALDEQARQIEAIKSTLERK